MPLTRPSPESRNLPSASITSSLSYIGCCLEMPPCPQSSSHHGLPDPPTVRPETMPVVRDTSVSYSVTQIQINDSNDSNDSNAAADDDDDDDDDDDFAQTHNTICDARADQSYPVPSRAWLFPSPTRSSSAHAQPSLRGSSLHQHPRTRLKALDSPAFTRKYHTSDPFF